ADLPPDPAPPRRGGQDRAPALQRGRRVVGHAASSTNLQSAFASRRCSTVRQSTSSSRGEQATYARHCALETATLSLLRDIRKSRPRGTSSPLDDAIE